MASTAAAVKEYGPPLSTAVSRVLACLLEKGVEFQLIDVNMAKGEDRKPDYLNIQPTDKFLPFRMRTFRSLARSVELELTLY